MAELVLKFQVMLCNNNLIFKNREALYLKKYNGQFYKYSNSTKNKNI